MKRMTYSHTIDIVFALVLFCTFAASVLLVLVTGAGAYADISSAMEQRYEERTCVSYIATKLRHYDTDRAVTVGSFEGSDALFLEEQLGERTFQTVIYYHDGYVKELFAEKGQPFSSDSGFPIIEAEGLSFEAASDSLIRIGCTGRSGRTVEMSVSLRSGMKGATV